jgi:hypothetical protein
MWPETILAIGLIIFGFFLYLFIRRIIILSIISYLHINEVDAVKSSGNKCLGLLISEKFVEKGQLLNYKRLRFLERLKASNTFPSKHMDYGINRVKEDIEKTAVSDSSCIIQYTNIHIDIENDHCLYQESVMLSREQVKFKIYFNWLLPFVGTPARN